MNFITRLDQILSEAVEPEYRAAVAIVQKGTNKWLLGLSTASDDRKMKWCFPGGGVKRGESPEDAAVRECREETGVKSKAVGDAFRYHKDGRKKDVAFVHCKVRGTVKFDMNNEFVAVGFFTVREMRSLELYKNVKDLIKRVQSC